MRKLLIPLMLTAVLASCNKYDTDAVAPVEITLKAAIANVSEETKSPFELTVPTAENPLTAAVWASTTSKSYQGSQTKEPEPTATVIDYHNSTCFTSNESQLLDHKLFYPSIKTGEKYTYPTVYFVAFCPRSESGWQVDPEKKGSYNIAQHIFEGNSDVMYAPEVHNSLATSSDQPQFHFQHILTWLKFQVVADKEAIDAWGDLEYIKIISEDRVRINVSDNTTTFGFSESDHTMSTYTYSKGVSTDQEFKDKSIELTDTAQEVSYVLCAPVKNAKAADKEYTVIVKTKYRPETQVGINLVNKNGSNFEGDTTGKQFTVTLRFKLGDKVVTTATVSTWENGGIGVHQFTE